MLRSIGLLFHSLVFLLRHPLSRGRRGAALVRWLRWQLGSRLVPGGVVVPFVDEALLLVHPGMTGATGNVYLGLHEFPDMSFLLHLLREDDLFVDIGANVGSYTVLAAQVRRARGVSIEPVPATFRQLRANLLVNDIVSRVEALNLGVGSESGVLNFTSGLDTVNHVLSRGESCSDCIAVPVQTLDSLLAGRSPILMKIDVEGFETCVIEGAQNTLGSASLLAVIMELNGSGNRYGFDEAALHQRMCGFGFAPYAYDPFSRVLVSLQGGISRTGNTIYLREPERVQDLLRFSPAFSVNGASI